MKKIFSTIKRLLRVQYRLSVMYRGETKVTNIYGLKFKLLRNMAKSMDVTYWSIYKTGPLGIGERKVDSSEWKGGDK